MGPIEIIVIIAVVVIVGGVFGNYIYKKVKGKPTGQCACCGNDMKRNFKKIAKEIEKENKCNCGCNN